MNMRINMLSYRNAFIFSFGISLLLNVLFLVSFLYGRDVGIPPDGKMRPPFSFNLHMTLTHLIFNFMLAFLLYILNFRILKNHPESVGRLVTCIVATFLSTFILSFIFSNLHMEFGDFRPPPKRFIGGGFFRDLFIAVIVLFSSQLMYVSQKQQQIALENARLISENIKSRYEVLKNQVDPHFLFNSLNTLNSLIKIDAEKAQEYVQQLSSVFRYTLQTKEAISLQEELKFTSSYCHLMKIRYGDSLVFKVVVDEAFYNHLIVPLSMQMLVENAIKHNVVSSRQPLMINISTTQSGCILVSNPIQPKKDPESGERIGLSNLEERYRLMWQKEIRISKENNIFQVEVPLINPNSPEK